MTARFTSLAALLVLAACQSPEQDMVTPDISEETEIANDTALTADEAVAEAANAAADAAADAAQTIADSNQPDEEYVPIYGHSIPLDETEIDRSKREIVEVLETSCRQSGYNCAEAETLRRQLR